MFPRSAPPAGASPSAAQAAAFAHLRAHEHDIRNAILAALLVAYPGWRDHDGLEEDEEEFMPPVERPDQFKALLGLANVHLLPVAKEGLAYIGFEFGCTWDEEHGFGAMTHRGHVVEIGQADVSFDARIAEGDAQRVD